MATVAILGVGPSVGSGLARQFATNGDDLILVARSGDTTSSLATELAGSVTVRTATADITDEGSIQRLVDSWIADGCVPDTVIYNPAVNPNVTPSETDVETLASVFETMLYGPIRVVRALLPAMRGRKSGTIIFTGGGFGVHPGVPYAPHSIAKAALRNYVQGLHQELKGEGIHAATVTIYRPVKDGADMAACADAFVALHRQTRDVWEWERSFGAD